jgi:hypothetical protein
MLGGSRVACRGKCMYISERGPFSLVTTIEEPLERKSSGYGLEVREYVHRDPSSWPCGSLYQQKLALNSPTSGGRLIGIVHSRTQATEFLCISQRRLDLGTSRWWAVNFTPRQLYPGKSPRYPLDMSLSGYQSWYGRHGEVKILYPPPTGTGTPVPESSST